MSKDILDEDFHHRISYVPITREVVQIKRDDEGCTIENANNLSKGFEIVEDWKSDKIDKLAAALSKAQASMGGVKKGSINTFYKSNYADINNCLEACLPSLTANGLSITQGNRFCSINGYYVTTMLMHESGQWIKSEVRMPLGAKKDAQAVGGASTYGRRYGLSAICGVAQKDDDGNEVSNTQIK